MGIGFVASWKTSRWAFPPQCPPHPRKQQRHPFPLRGREAFFESGRSVQHAVLGGGEILHRDTLKGYACSYGALESIENISADHENLKINSNKESNRGFHNLSKPVAMMGVESTNVASLTSSSCLQFSLLIENLDKIEDILAGTDLVRLEREILVHIRRLGALKLFNACLSRTLMASSTVNPNFLLTEHFKDCSLDFPVGEQKVDTVVCTGKKKQRILRRIRASQKAARMSYSSKYSERIHKVNTKASSPNVFGGPRGSSESRSRSVIARNESEMSKGVKEIANLERTRVKLEGEIGRAASYARWAEAAGIDEKTLQQRLQYGWYCRDKLIKSTQSLVMYLARNYRGKGIAFDDLLQAGNMGVLKGAERFDITRGYQFSTYVQYWIRKSILALVGRHSKGIHIPVRMEKVIKRIQKARRTIYSREGRYPQDEDIAGLTGLSLAYVRLARKCSRVMGSIDQEIGHGWCTKFMEVTADTSVKAPEEIILRQNMREDIGELLQGLHPRERQVLVLRYGLEDGRCMSLGEIGRLFSVTKEWIRKIEKAALAKIMREDLQREMKYYLNILSLK